MKNYFNFKLTGIRILPTWIFFFVFFIAPVYFLYGEFIGLTAKDVSAEGPSSRFFLILGFISIMYFVFFFLFTKLIFKSIGINEVKLKCRYNAVQYLWIIVSGLVFSLLTLGIYFPWMINNIHRFFINGVSWKSNSFKFKGDGFQLFMIFTFTIILPFLILGIVIFSILDSNIDLWIYELIVIIIFISLIYLVFKWMINIGYKDYTLKIDVGFFAAIGKIVLELIMAVIFVAIFEWSINFSNAYVGNYILWEFNYFPVTGKAIIELVMAVVTANFYFPMAFIRLYKYFTTHTHSNVVDGSRLSLGYEGEQVDVFLFMWGQILLTVITAGIYFPWAFSKIVKRFLAKTYIIRQPVE